MSQAAVLTQLIALGHMAKYLTTNPTITFWRFVHHRHSAFAIDNQPLVWEGSSTIGSSASSTLKLHRSGDLVTRMWIVADLPGIANVKADASGNFQEVVEDTYKNHKGDTWKTAYGATAVAATSDSDAAYWTNEVGFALCKEVSLSIGSQPIDTLYMEYQSIWEELSGHPGKKLGSMIGSGTDAEIRAHSKFQQRLYVPLSFWFCQSSGSALPLVSLSYHDIRVSVKWNGVKDLVRNFNHGGAVTCVRPHQTNYMDALSNGELAKIPANSTTNPWTPLTDAHVKTFLEVSYVFLAQAEREKFASGSFELLMTETQKLPPSTGIDASSAHTISLDFNHAVLEVFTVARRHAARDAKDWFNFDGITENITGMRMDPITKVDMRINNQSRFTPQQEAKYFRKLVPHTHHTNIPSKFIYNFCFSLFPEQQQPSGSLNYSRVDNAKLALTFDKNIPDKLDVLTFARNYNVLRVSLGLAGKSYAS